MIETELSRVHLQTRGGREIPQGAEVGISKGRLPGHVHAMVRLPGATRFTSFGDIPIQNGEIRIPIRSVFMSYAKEDTERVDALVKRLWEDGVYVWLDTRDLLPGDRWRDRIDEAIAQADFVLVALSPRSCTKTGEVQRELKYALDQASLRPRGVRYLLPVLIEPCEPPRELRDFHWVDLAVPEAYRGIVKAIRAGS